MTAHRTPPKTSPKKKKPNYRAKSTDQAALVMPPQWPGAFAAYKHSKQAVKYNANAVIAWIVVSIVASGALSVLSNIHNLAGPIKGLSAVLSYIIAPLFSAIMAKLFIASVRRQPMSFGEAFSRGLPYWLNAIVLSIAVGVTEIVSFLLLIVPFFFVWPRLSLATYFLVDKNLDPIEAYKASWAATKGYVGVMYGILGAQIAMGLLAITIIGIPFAIYFLIMYSAVHAVIYEVIRNSTPSDSTAPVEA